MTTPFPLVNPDLTFYYSVDNAAGAVFAEQPIGPNIVQTFVSPLYDIIPPIPIDLKISIGSLCDVGTLFDVNNTTGYYDTVDSSVFYFKNGSIAFNPNILWVQNSTTKHYLFPPNSTNIYSIVSGTKDYLNYKGFIEIITDAENINRKVNIYFLKTYTATASASASKTDAHGNTIVESVTASASSTVSAEDAQHIALTNALGLANELV